MKDILIQSDSDQKIVDTLLAENIPSYRQAYSDRTSWIMSCLSELAYIRFNPLFGKDEQKDYFIEKVSELINSKKVSALYKLLNMVNYDADTEKETLIKELSSLEMILLKPFDENGTQAILVSYKDAIILAFRGTEATSIKDIKSDARAISTSCSSGGMIHSGFNEAYDDVRGDIEKALKADDIINKPLYITGHSLGGALATIAAKKLSHKGGLAACYTFGSPRVGDEEWIEGIKTPIYRVVNASDCVTMLPPSSETITVLGWALQFIPMVGKPARTFLLSKFGGYLHCGNMRYLTNCTGKCFEDVKLLYSVNLFFRIKGLILKKLPWKRFLGDHSISVYRKKLTIIANKQNS